MIKMEEIAEIFVFAVILAVVLLFVGAILGALIGAIVGWIIGFTPLGTWILEFLRAFGVDGITMVHVGTTLGFIGGFFGSNAKFKGD